MLVPAVDETVVFVNVNELPPVFSPLIVTLSAPLRSMSASPAVTTPVTVREAPPEGEIVRVFHVPSLSTAPVAGSSMFPIIVTLIFAEV